MNTKQKNRLTMMMALIAICNIPASVYASLPKFSNFITLLGDIIKRIHVQSLIQDYDYKGKALHKKGVISDLITRTLNIGRKTVAYASATDNDELKQAVNYSESELKKLSGQELLTACTLVQNESRPLLLPLGLYGVTEAMLDEHLAVIGLFEHQITCPREGVVRKKNATMAIKSAFSETAPVLKSMDELVVTIKDSNPDDYNNYKNARIIVDYGKRKKNTGYSVSGTAVDFESGLPLSGVQLAIVGTTIGCITDISGLYKLPVKKAGPYKVRAEKGDYKIQVLDVLITGEDTNLDIELEKDGES